MGLILLVTSVSLGAANPAFAQQQDCPASTRQQALSLGDQLRQGGAYERAGKCYEAAGAYALANRTFLEALEPESKATAHKLSGQRDQAMTLLHQVGQAFNSQH